MRRAAPVDRLRRARRAVALAALLAAGASHALSTDREQPIHIEADQAVLDDQAGVAEYEGSVVLTQGSIRILAERLTVYMDADDALERAVAVGAPARFRQLPDDAQEYVRASARTLDYRAGESLLELTREARIVQGGDLFSGDHITYDTGTARVQARRAEDGDERVRVTFTPKKDGGDADSE